MGLLRCALVVSVVWADECTDLYKGKGKKCHKFVGKIAKKPQKYCASNAKWVSKKECEQTCWDLGEPHRYGACGGAVVECADSDERVPDWFDGKTCSKMAKKKFENAPEAVCAANEAWISQRICERTCADLGEPHAYAACGHACGDADCRRLCTDDAPPSWLKKGKTCAKMAKKFKNKKDCGGTAGSSKDDWVESTYCEASCASRGHDYAPRTCDACDADAPTCATCCGRCAASEVESTAPRASDAAGAAVLGCACLETTAASPRGVSFALDTGGGDCYYDLHGATAGGVGGAGDDDIFVVADDVGAGLYENATAGLRGGGGSDAIVVVGDGARHVEGGAGDDALTIVGDGAEYVDGGAGDDVVVVRGDGNARVYGDGDAAMSDAGDDEVLVVGDDNDYVYGGYGEDNVTIIGDRNRYVYAGPGDDSLTVVGDMNYDLNADAYAGLAGDAGDRGGDGDDVVRVVGDGNTFVYGGGGDDVITIVARAADGAHGSVAYVFGDGRNENAHDGADRIYVRQGAGGDAADADYIFGGGGNDIIVVDADRPAAPDGLGGRGAGVDGGAGADTIHWTGDNGRVDGGPGGDVIIVVGEGTLVHSGVGDDVSCDRDCGADTGSNVFGDARDADANHESDGAGGIGLPV